jgi:hypothetical protein
MLGALRRAVRGTIIVAGVTGILAAAGVVAAGAFAYGFATGIAGHDASGGGEGEGEEEAADRLRRAS